MNYFYIIYQIDCAVCGEDYVGETVRELEDRVREHLATARQLQVNEPWGKHWRRHRDQEVAFKNVQVLAGAKDIVDRKIRESVEIRHRKPKVNISRGWKLT